MKLEAVQNTDGWVRLFNLTDDNAEDPVRKPS